MKKTLIALMAMASFTFGADLVTELKLDGNFSDTQNNLTFGGTESLGWSTSSPISGSNGYVSVSDNHAVWHGNFVTAPSTTNFAITLFINASELPVSTQTGDKQSWTTQWIIGGSTSPTNGLKIGLGHDGQIKTGLHNIGGVGVSSGSSTIETNQWYQVGLSVTDALESSKSVWTLYINGEVVATKTDDNRTISFSNVALFEGADSTGNGRYTGYVDDIQFYNVSSLDDAKSIMSAQAARLVPEPTTATLSLLALAGLAARRRRK